jgi:hypothetical protein
MARPFYLAAHFTRWLSADGLFRPQSPARQNPGVFLPGRQKTLAFLRLIGQTTELLPCPPSSNTR